MPPKFELAMSKESSSEAIRNFRVLAEHFPNLIESNGEFVISGVEDLSNKFIYLNSYEDELYIYPKRERWFLKTSHELGMSGLKLFDSVGFYPINIPGERRRVLMVNEDLWSYEVSLYDSEESNSECFGKMIHNISAETGEYNTGESIMYHDAKEFLEGSTGLAINDFYIRLATLDSLAVGEIQTGTLEIGMDLE
jgi:hypothetical protein